MEQTRDSERVGGRESLRVSGRKRERGDKEEVGEREGET